MKGPSIILITSFVAGSAAADPAGETIRGMDQCFVLARSADAICGDPSNSASARLDCLRKARDAKEQCLDQVHARMELHILAQPEDAPNPVPESQPNNAAVDARPERKQEAESPAAASQTGDPAASPSRQADAQPDAEPPSNHNAAYDHPEKSPEAERPAATSQTGDPAASPPRQADAQPKQAAVLVDPMPRRQPPDHRSSGWIVGETVSPVDFSPLLVAQIGSVASNKPDAPSALVLRCRAGRTNMSLRTRGTWHPTRAGDVEVVFGDGRQSPQRFRWPLASDGKSASSADDMISAVQGLADATVSISVNDGTGDVGTAMFQLAGIDAVRGRIATMCRWPSVAAQSRAQ